MPPAVPAISSGPYCHAYDLPLRLKHTCAAQRLGEAFYWARRYKDAVAAIGEVIGQQSDFERAYGYRDLAYYGLGELQSARASCEAKPDFWVSQWCLAMTYEKLAGTPMRPRS